MKNTSKWQLAGFNLGLAFGIALLSVACSSPTLGTPPNSNPPPPSSTSAMQVTPTPTERWIELLARMPYPYTTPLPLPTPSAIDGTYAKFEDQEGTPVPCRRCPDYAPERGIWRLNLDKGVFRVFYQFWNWTGIGSYTVSEDQIAFFNDPNCYEDVGRYTWKLEGGKLNLKVIEDSCAIGLRAKNLTMRPWLSCQPPNKEAAITDHWLKPPGCYQPDQ